MALAGRGEFRGVTPRLLPVLIHPDRTGDEELTGEVMAMAERVGCDAFLRQQRLIMERPDSRSAFRRPSAGAAHSLPPTAGRPPSPPRRTRISAI